MAALGLGAAGCGSVSPPETWQGPATSGAPAGSQPAQSAAPSSPASGKEAGGRAPAQSGEDNLAVPEDYSEKVSDYRRKKDDLYRSGKDSPVPADARGTFKSLDYYAVDPSWRLVLPLIREGRPATRTFISNTGEKRSMRREGYVEFTRDGIPVKLALYHILDDPVPDGSLWLGFADAGSGKETYPGGRYIDTELRPDGTVVLDFNFAYNPLCAYGWAYSCPLAPSENRLKIPVRAGENGFHHQ